MTDITTTLTEAVENLSDAEVRVLVRCIAERKAGADAIQVAADQLALTGRIGSLRDPADVESLRRYQDRTFGVWMPIGYGCGSGACPLSNVGSRR